MSDGGFTNAIIGGAETLIRSAIKSAVYVAGSIGWRIAKDGTADLNNTTVRGSLTVTGTNNSSITIANVNTTVQVDLQPPDPNGGSPAQVNPAVLYAITSGLALADTAFSTYLYAPQWQSGIGAADLRSPYLWFLTARYDGFAGPQIKLGFTNSFDATTVDTTIDSNLIVNGNMVNSYGVDRGRGLVTANGIVASSAGIGATETIIFGVPSTTYKANRAYKVVFSGMVASSVAGADPVMRIRKDNGTTPPTGTALNFWRVACRAAASSYDAEYTTYFIVGAADVTATLALTIVGSGAFNASVVAAAGFPATLTVEDCGKASTYSWAVTLT